MYLHQDWRDASKLQKISKKSKSVKETGPSYSQKSVPSDNPSRNISHKQKKYCKIGPDFKNAIPSFGCALTAIINI